MTEHGDPISYQALQRGTPVVSSDTFELGTVALGLACGYFRRIDGIVMRAGERRVWVDAPEVARITERRVTLTIDAAQAAELTDYAPGAPEYRANVRGGRLSRFFGGGWKRH